MVLRNHGLTCTDPSCHQVKKTHQMWHNHLLGQKNANKKIGGDMSYPLVCHNQN